MMPINAAQQILIALGVPDLQVLLGTRPYVSKSHTKKGPGRKHLNGKKKTEANNG